MPKQQTRLRYRIGDIYGTELDDLYKTLSRDELAAGFTALRLQEALQFEQRLQGEDNQVPKARAQTVENRHKALDRLSRLNRLANGVGRILIGQQIFGGAQYRTLVLPISTENGDEYYAIADSDVYGNAVYACRTTDVPAVLGYSKAHSLKVGARRFIHSAVSFGPDEHLENSLFDYITDRDTPLIDIERRDNSLDGYAQNGQLITEGTV